MTEEDLPLVSVITPSLNQGRFIEETILSVKSQDYPRLEHLIIDGGSTDGTLEILERYDHLVWVSEPDHGQAEAVNKGFRMAKGEILGWLNADDVYLSRTAVAEAVQAFLARPSTGVIYGDYALMNEEGLIFRVTPALSRISFRRLAWYCLGQPSAFMRRWVVRSFPLRRDLRYRMDYEYWLRMCQAGVQFSYISRLWSAFRVHARGKTVVAVLGAEGEKRQIQEEYFNGSWRVQWPIEAIVRRSLGLWLRVRGFMKIRELYGAPLAFYGKRSARLAFYVRQLISRAFQYV